MAMAKIETEGIENLIRKLEKAGGDARQITVRLMTETAQEISQDTYKALQSQNLPRAGAYSTGKTLASVLTDPQARWEGDTAWTPIGFDFSKPGAGGFLISGTPRMAPDQELRKMYKMKKYMNEKSKNMMEELWQELHKELGGAG